jgi:osmotically-inducible protein OsmY
MCASTMTRQKTDAELKRDVEDELKWEPSIDATEIGVAVKDGVVTLSGYVDSYFEKWTAERVAQRVAGVTAVVQNIEVRLPGSSTRTDVDIAKAAVNALDWTTSVPKDRIKVKVENGWIKLEGDVDWQYQKNAAERAVRDLYGVKGVTNLITVKPRVTPTDIKSKIEESFKRQATLDAMNVKVSVQGSKVTLTGTVRTWAERDAARQAAWSAPGVTEVINEITVRP